MTELEFDDAVMGFYEAAIGAQPWGMSLEKVRQGLAAQVVNIFGVAKETRAVSFSHEVGSASPDLLMRLPSGEMANGHRHVDDAFWAQDPFEQKPLMTHGGRHSAGLKVFENADQAVHFGAYRPSDAPPFDEREEALMARLALHLQNALATFVAQQNTVRPAAVGFELLQRMPQPLMLLTNIRAIVYSNPAAKRLLERGDILSSKGGLLCARQPADDAKLLIGLRALGLTAGSYLGNTRPTDKVFLRLTSRSDRKRPAISSCVGLVG